MPQTAGKWGKPTREFRRGAEQDSGQRGMRMQGTRYLRSGRRWGAGDRFEEGWEFSRNTISTGHSLKMQSEYSHCSCVETRCGGCNTATPDFTTNVSEFTGFLLNRHLAAGCRKRRRCATSLVIFGFRPQNVAKQTGTCLNQLKLSGWKPWEHSRNKEVWVLVGNCDGNFLCEILLQEGISSSSRSGSDTKTFLQCKTIKQK